MEVSRGGWEDNSGIGFPPIRAFVGGGQWRESPPGSCWMHQVLTAQDAGEGYTDTNTDKDTDENTDTNTDKNTDTNIDTNADTNTKGERSKQKGGH